MKFKHIYFILMMTIIIISCNEQQKISSTLITVPQVEYILLPDSEYSTDYCVSMKGIQLIKNQEGFSARPYWDVNNYSVGYGHHGSITELPSILTKEEAEEYLKEDLEWVNTHLYEIFKIEYPYRWPQSVIDSYGSIIYNIGWTRFTKTQLCKRLGKLRHDKDGNILREDLDSILSDNMKKGWQTNIQKRRRVEYYYAVTGYHDLNRKASKTISK